MNSAIRTETRGEYEIRCYKDAVGSWWAVYRGNKCLTKHTCTKRQAIQFISSLQNETDAQAWSRLDDVDKRVVLVQVTAKEKVIIHSLPLKYTDLHKDLIRNITKKGGVRLMLKATEFTEYLIPLHRTDARES